MSRLALSGVWAVTCSRDELAGVIGDIANCFQAKRGIYMRKMPTLFILLVLSVAVLAWRSTSSSNEKAANTEIKGHTEISEDAVQPMVEGVRLRNGKQIPAAEPVQKIEILDVYRAAASVKVVTGRWIGYMHLSKLNGE
jgi:hypothetical protein